MATVTWQGGVEAVAQVSDGSVTAFDAATTYTVTIGGYDISVAGNTDTATTAADLVTALTASTHEYFAAITWSVPSGSTVRGTAKTAGAPFSATLSASGGTGTVTNFSDITACTGPHHADAADNWSSGTLPAAADTIIIDGGPSILYGLTGVTAALARAEVRQSFINLIGLEPSQFATSLDGVTTVTTVPEYRQAYFELSADEIVIGEHVGPGSPTGSSRIAIDQQKAGASVLNVRNTSATQLNNRPAVRYQAANASADVLVETAPGGVGIAIEAGETSTIGDVLVIDSTANSQVYVGSGVTLTNFEQHGGISSLSAASTVTAVTVRDGVLQITGYDYTITTLTVYNGEVTDVHENTGGAEWGTIAVWGGRTNLPGATNAANRSFTTLTLNAGDVFGDWSRLSGTVSIAMFGDVGTVTVNPVAI